jgi:hypothetical protein
MACGGPRGVRPNAEDEKSVARDGACSPIGEMGLEAAAQWEWELGGWCGEKLDLMPGQWAGDSEAEA